MPLTKEDVHWAFKVLLGREPENPEAVERMIETFPNMKSLKAAMFVGDEFVEVNRDILKRLPMTIPPRKEIYSIHGKNIIDLTAMNNIIPHQGIYEKAEIDFISRKLRPGDVVLDAAGGRGIFSVVAALCVGTSGRVYTVETDPRCVSLINENARANGVEQSIELLGTVVTDGSLKNSDEPSKAIDADANASFPLIETAINDSLDYIYKCARRINFMRIDLGGGEVLAFESATHILSRDRPLILSKVDPNLLEQVSNSNWQYYFGFMAGFGYKPHILDEDGLGKTHPLLEPGRAYSVVFSTSGHYVG